MLYNFLNDDIGEQQSGVNNKRNLYQKAPKQYSSFFEKLPQASNSDGTTQDTSKSKLKGLSKLFQVILIIKIVGKIDSEKLDKSIEESDLNMATLKAVVAPVYRPNFFNPSSNDLPNIIESDSD